MQSADISLIACLKRKESVVSRTRKFCILLVYVRLLVFWLCYCTFVKNWWGAHSVFVKYVRYNLIVSHRYHVWNCWLVNSVAYLIYQYMHDWLCNTFHIPCSGGVLVIPFKPEAEGSCTWLSCCYITLH